MELSIRPRPYELPSYSLTGDLLRFLRCGLQYRYFRIGKLPISRPVQLWFGQFVHGVLEEAYRRYRESDERGAPALPPWPVEEIASILELIKARLAAQGLVAWTRDLEELGDRRATVAVQELGPCLFPMIYRAEVRLTGARRLPDIPPQLQFREADRYEMVGVIDVVSYIQMNDPMLMMNPLYPRIAVGLPTWPPREFEVIIDYKGSRRPPSAGDAGGLWSQYEWQLQTYGDLRRRQSDAFPVVAGVLLYLNELSPSRPDLIAYKRELASGTTDVVPPRGSLAERQIQNWRPRDPIPDLPFDFRLARAMRVVPIDDASIDSALLEFDNVVARMETCRGQEILGGTIIDSWERNADDEDTCAPCDARLYCPDFRTRYAASRREMSARLPGERPRS
jgi:hypothetical protein